MAHRSVTLASRAGAIVSRVARPAASSSRRAAPAALAARVGGLSVRNVGTAAAPRGFQFATHRLGATRGMATIQDKRYVVVEERHDAGAVLRVTKLDLIDEYVAVLNRSQAAVSLDDWRIVSDTGHQNFEFPKGLTIQPGETLRLWSGRGADKKHAPPLDLFWTRRFVWNNHGDCAILLSPTGSEASYMRVEAKRVPKKGTKAALLIDLRNCEEKLHDVEHSDAELQAALAEQRRLADMVATLRRELDDCREATAAARAALVDAQAAAEASSAAAHTAAAAAQAEAASAAAAAEEARVEAEYAAATHSKAMVDAVATPQAGAEAAEVVGNADSFATQSLSGRCSCGACGFEATGPSALNFTCHCSVCRAAASRPSVAAAGFKPTQVRWVNREGMREDTPHGSNNTRLYCGSCDGYLGEDATGPLGVVALPLDAATEVADCYKPNCHIFYDTRVSDVADSAPKWKTLPRGELEEPSPGANVDWSINPASTDQWQPHSGRFRKDVLPVSPTRAPDMGEYTFTEADVPANHVTRASPSKLKERVKRKYLPSAGTYVARTERRRDAIIIGGGHNGLVTAAYLAEAGKDVLVLERRHVVGGAAVTEELVPGFKFSRASYLAGLLRPKVIEELELEQHGFEYLPRDPSSFTPSKVDGPNGGKSLMFWDSMAKTKESIAQFSAKDAEAFEHYERFLMQVRKLVTPLLDNPLPHPGVGSWTERRRTWGQIKDMVTVGMANSEVLVPFYELLTAPASHILDRYFESEMLKTTLAKDAVVGAMCSPKEPGSAYVLLHHVMGEASGKEGVWSYVKGGMGALSGAIAQAAVQRGAELQTNATVSEIMYEELPLGRVGSPTHKATGVRMEDGTELLADTVISNSTPYHTFLELLPGLSAMTGHPDGEKGPLPEDFARHIRFADYSCGAMKINLAVDALPNFACMPNDPSGRPGPQHQGTIHFENTMEDLELAHREASMGMPTTTPIVEMTIPSAVDPTLAPPGKHVVQIFVQYAPYDMDPKFGSWADPAFAAAFCNRIYNRIDEFAPGFSKSIIGEDVLTPLDLERVFGLHKGNINHMSLGIHQIGYARPAPHYAHHSTPVKGLYLCGAGAHPGGGVMGAAGRNCARVVLDETCC